ncbi:MAG: alpha-N-arabinofuranosidase [Jatrophihabitans sp.]
MSEARLVAHPDLTVADVPRRLFGSFVEHMGRCVYTGIYEPGHPTADEDGFRKDVLELVRELGVSAVRYPGGNFVSGYRWEDGVGPKDERPTRLDPAWHSIETNEFGLDEFVNWATKAEVEVMMAMNLGTRGTQEALDLVEYANHPSGTQLSDARIANGAEKPHGIRMWCLGNEMDGPWQTGHKTAHEYGRLAAETGNALRQLDPDLELVACGSSNAQMATFGTWEDTVLDLAYDQVDFVSLHAYYYEGNGVDRASFLASAVDMDRFIEAVVATADAVGARRRSEKRIKLSFDEWNVWYVPRFSGENGPRSTWERHPRLIEDEYSALDAVVVGSLLISLLKHSDRVRSASQAQLVNVIGPIRSEPGGPAWRQTIFYPFAQTAAHAKGSVLHTPVQSPTVGTSRFGDVAAVDAVVTHDDGAITVLAVNRSQDGVVALDVDLSAWTGIRILEASMIHEDDPDLTNNAGHQDRVTPRELPGVTVTDGRLHADLPPVSWAMIRLTDRA